MRVLLLNEQFYREKIIICRINTFPLSQKNQFCTILPNILISPGKGGGGGQRAGRRGGGGVFCMWCRCDVTLVPESAARGLG